MSAEHPGLRNLLTAGRFAAMMDLTEKTLKSIAIPVKKGG